MQIDIEDVPSYVSNLIQTETGPLGGGVYRLTSFQSLIKQNLLTEESLKNLFGQVDSDFKIKLNREQIKNLGDLIEKIVESQKFIN